MKVHDNQWGVSTGNGSYVTFLITFNSVFSCVGSCTGSANWMWVKGLSNAGFNYRADSDGYWIAIGY